MNETTNTTPPPEQRSQKFFTKDGDDTYVPRRKRPSLSPIPRKIYKYCECGGKLKPYGAFNSCGRISSKCNKCGRRKFYKIYKGVDGLAECY